MMHTNPSYPAISYLVMLPENSPYFGLIFGQGGAGHHCHDVFRKLEVGLVVVSVALINNSKHLGNNTSENNEGPHSHTIRKAGDGFKWCESF
jgi:hypothetical protein